MKVDRKKVELAMARACMGVNELSDAAGINRKSVSKFLNGQAAKPVTIGLIARALKVDVLEIIEQE